MPAACSVMFRWHSCQSSSSTLLTSLMLSFARCRFTLGFHRANVKPLSVNTRPFMNDLGDRFALARSRLSLRHGVARHGPARGGRVGSCYIVLVGRGRGGMAW